MHFVIGAAVFLASIAAAVLLASHSTVATIAVVCAGVFMGGIFVLYPVFQNVASRKGKGQIDFSPTKGVSFQWEVRSNQPIRTVLPTEPTNTTQNERAISLCEEGRLLISSQSTNKDALLDEAYSKFKAAATLDPGYWEPRLNIAQILLLRGKLKDAFSEAESIRLIYPETPLAFAKAGLIMARSIEQQIGLDDPIDERQRQYQTICNILRGNLKHCSGHLTSLMSLGRAMLLAGASVEEMSSFLEVAARIPEFKEQFFDALKREGILDKFKEQFPDFFDINSEKDDSDEPR